MTYLGPNSFDPELVERAAQAVAIERRGPGSTVLNRDRKIVLTVLSAVAPDLRAGGSRQEQLTEHSEGCEKWMSAAPGQRGCVCKAYQRGYGDD